MSDFKTGDIVWFLKSTAYGKIIKFAMVNEVFASEIATDFLVVAECRTIDGVPIEKLSFPTAWKKLPKNWNYSMNLFEVGFDKINDDRLNKSIYDMSNKEIQQLYAERLIVKAIDKKYYVGFPEERIERGQWRIVMNCGNPKPYGYSLHKSEAYSTYKEAKQALDGYNEESRRIQNLSDYEWSVEQMDSTLDKWAKMFDVPNDTKAKVRERLLQISDFEEVCVRISGRAIDWKYDKKKRWNTIPESDI